MRKWLPVVLMIVASIIMAGCGGGGGGGSEKDPNANRTTPGDVMANAWIDVAAGTYSVGDDKYPNFPKKNYKVKAFKIQTYEVTNAQYKKWLDTLNEEDKAKHTPKEHFTGRGVWKGGWYPEGEHNHPVVNVDYHDAAAYATGNGWSLPTRSEWEAAAAGPDTRLFPWGNSFDKSKGNIINPDGTMPVGSFPAGKSWCGVMDMCGNVWEWTQSFYDNTKRAHLMKGGSWLEDQEAFYENTNNLTAPHAEFGPNRGFRCVMR